MKTVHHISHLHLHLGVYFAVATILVTALHTSQEMIGAIYAQQHFGDIENHTMRESREAETHTASAQISFVRRNYIGGA